MNKTPLSLGKHFKLQTECLEPATTHEPLLGTGNGICESKQGFLFLQYEPEKNEEKKTLPPAYFNFGGKVMSIPCNREHINSGSAEVLVSKKSTGSFFPSLPFPSFRFPPLPFSSLFSSPLPSSSLPLYLKMLRKRCSAPDVCGGVRRHSLSVNQPLWTVFLLKVGLGRLVGLMLCPLQKSKDIFSFWFCSFWNIPSGSCHVRSLTTIE